MDFDAAKFVLDFFQFVLTIGVGVYAWRIKHDNATRLEIDALKVALADAGIRISAAEARMDNMPTQQAIHELAMSVSELHGDLRALTETVKGMSDLSTRVERQLGLLMEHHLDLAKAGGGAG